MLFLTAVSCQDSRNSVVEPSNDPHHDRIEALRALMGTPVDEMTPARLKSVLWRFDGPVVITKLKPGQDWREVPIPSGANRIVNEGGFCGDVSLAPPTR